MAIAPLVGIVACANIWGFDDLTLGPDSGSEDATTSNAPEAGGDAEADAVGVRNDSGGEAADAHVSGEDGEAGEAEAAAAREAGARDAGGDGAAAAQCKAICKTGCCDSSGFCQAGTLASACGGGGAACATCSGPCPLGPPCCVATSKQCGCTTATLLCN